MFLLDKFNNLFMREIYVTYINWIFLLAIKTLSFCSHEYNFFILIDNYINTYITHR